MSSQLLESIGLGGLDIAYVLIALIVLIIVLFVLVIIQFNKMSKLQKKYAKLNSNYSPAAWNTYSPSAIPCNADWP